ncbi:hypothetical protein [Flavobacterium selenitireducens]|uniref:hypothetical protein n=1 Tax=Flavobacterium selenitireducens TaxID=2722704 RepID=UPI00168BD437|nr:hypothetical protein [Flavobacterium selenitireducens]MBD3582996.1 hypothetical protein [Flavobacterium selenitireducens]
MKKLAFLFLACLALVSCGDDDSGSGSGPKPTLLTLTDGGATETRTFTYDSKNRISTMAKPGVTYTFTYDENGKLHRMANANGHYEFHYAANNLVSVSNSEGQDWDVNQNGDNYELDGFTYSLNDAGDFTALSDVAITYGSGRGIFANVRAMNPLAMFLADQISFLYMSKVRPQEILNPDSHPYMVGSEENGMPTLVNALDIEIAVQYD